MIGLLLTLYLSLNFAGFLQIRNVTVSETSVCLAKCYCRRNVTRSFKLVHQMIANDHCHLPTALQPRSTAGIHLACD